MFFTQQIYGQVKQTTQRTNKRATNNFILNFLTSLD